jgi:hypothetical protein
VASATVVAFAVTGGRPGGQIGSTVTDANGDFSMTIGAYQGPVMLQAGAGTYRDEATGSFMTMGSGDVVTAVLPSPAAGATLSGIQITPVTAMAQARAQQLPGGMTDANIASANTAMGNYFLVSDILHVAPMNPLLRGSGASAGADERNYGMTLAAMSQYALTVGLTNTAALVTSMMSDASDGIMDGRSGSGPILMDSGGMLGLVLMPANAGSSGLATAMTKFASSPANVSGLTSIDVAALVQKLTASAGKF